MQMFLGSGWAEPEPKDTKSAQQLGKPAKPPRYSIWHMFMGKPMIYSSQFGTIISDKPWHAHISGSFVWHCNRSIRCFFFSIIFWLPPMKTCQNWGFLHSHCYGDTAAFAVPKMVGWHPSRPTISSKNFNDGTSLHMFEELTLWWTFT